MNGDTPAGLAPEFLGSPGYDPYAGSPDVSTTSLYYTTYYDDTAILTPGINLSDVSDPDGDAAAGNNWFGQTLGGIGERLLTAGKNLFTGFLGGSVKSPTQSTAAGLTAQRPSNPAGLASFSLPKLAGGGNNMIVLVLIGVGAFFLFRGRS